MFKITTIQSTIQTTRAHNDLSLKKVADNLGVKMQCCTCPLTQSVKLRRFSSPSQLHRRGTNCNKTQLYEHTPTPTPGSGSGGSVWTAGRGCPTGPPGYRGGIQPDTHTWGDMSSKQRSSSVLSVYIHLVLLQLLHQDLRADHTTQR